MKILTVVGARPQFIKAAVVSRELRKTHDEVLVHTGQHYDYNMSDIFFEQLDLPKPDYNTGISGGTHGKMTGQMLMALENIMIREKPEGVLLYGDTNSTLAGALAAVKLNIPVIHVEAGNRLGTLSNPEEVNRILADHVSTLKLYCTESAFFFLKKEGISDNSFFVGDPMFDAFKYYSKKLGHEPPEVLKSIYNEEVELPAKFNYMTCHRQENTANIETLHNILSAMEELDEKCVYPVHPRNLDSIDYLIKEYNYKNIIFSKPVGYLMSLYLVNNSNVIVTDSGGLQREAFFAEKQCITVFDYISWPETMINYRNQLSKPDKNMILEKLSNNQKIVKTFPFGNGDSSKKIVNYIEKYINV